MKGFLYLTIDDLNGRKVMFKQLNAPELTLTEQLNAFYK